MYTKAEGIWKIKRSRRGKKQKERKRGENGFDSDMEGDSRIKVSYNFIKNVHIKIDLYGM